MTPAVLGVNAVFHDSAAALVVDGEIVAAAEEERFSRRKHGKPSVAFSTWELPERAAQWCLERAGLEPGELDAVAYSYDPALAGGEAVTGDPWEELRTTFASRAPRFLKTSLPGLDSERVEFVPHHVAHAASAYHGAGFESCAVLVLDGRGEAASHLAGHRRDGRLEVLAAQRLPDSLGLVYEELTAHLGFRRSSDEYKVMAMASYGRPSMLDELRERIRVDGEGGFVARDVEWEALAPRLTDGERWTPRHADLAASVQARLEEVLLELCDWLAERTGEPRLVMAGGVALNCVANSRLLRDGPFEQIWVQPAAGDSGTALGAATHVSERLGAAPRPMRSAALGREWSEEELEGWLRTAAVPFERCENVGAAVAERLAANEIVAWHQGRGEWGPRALGHRSLLADPRDPANLERLNDVKGREQFRPVAPMVLESRAAEIFADGPLPSPYMLFTHRVRPGWAERIPAAVHVDGTARIQTVAPSDQPLVARMLEEFERRTGVPVVVNTSLNTAGRPMVDDPRDALECFGSAPIDCLAIGPFLVSRGRFFEERREALAGAELSVG
ncbi:MAG TPA: carbamoyltransferase C-terminal domain-containing protein [Solirubrobacterales bacterium]